MKKTALNLALLCSISIACTQDVGDVDRTQPYRVSKSVFDGEWYHQKTTYDVPYTAGFTFTGETSELERVKWQIEESYLIAYFVIGFYVLAMICVHFVMQLGINFVRNEGFVFISNNLP